MSGSALSATAIAKDAAKYSAHLIKALNCTHHDSELVLECLRRKSVEEILGVEMAVPSHLTAFGPVVDGILLRDLPQNLIRQAAKDEEVFEGEEEAEKGVVAQHDLLFGVTKVSAFLINSLKE